MQERNRDKENDLFIERIKDKLTNYTLPVDDDSWDKLAEQLNQAPPKKSQRLLITIITVAASVALLFLIFSIDKKTAYHDTAERFTGPEKTITRDAPGKESIQQILRENIKLPKSFKKPKTNGGLSENALIAEVILKEETVEEKADASSEEKPNVAEKRSSVSPDSYRNTGKEEQPLLMKRKKQKSIRFSFGSGGNRFAENNTNSATIMESTGSNSPYFRAAAEVAAESRTQDILSYEYYPNVVHLPPLSIGVTVKKELNRTFAIESGIVYSFLETKFNRDSPKSKADLQLHYLGIPLNLHTRIYGNRFSPWEVYLSTGGMVEKGFLSHFVQKNYYDNVDNYVGTIVSNEKIKGLQWSVNIAPGVDYQFYKNYSLYLEPKLSYYFDNNQPVSSRTIHPLVFGINAGVRLNW